MSGKYVFSKALKELRFLHCQTSEHSNAVRYALKQSPLRQNTAQTIVLAERYLRAKVTDMSQIIPQPRIPYDEAPQPAHTHHDPRSA